MKRNTGMGMIKLILMLLFIILIVATTVYLVRMQYNKVKIETIKTVQQKQAVFPWHKFLNL